MGMLAMQTGFPGIFIHGTNKPWGVGMRTSHGCLHLYPEDAAELFPQLKPGTPVRVIDEPFLFGLDQDRWVMASLRTGAGICRQTTTCRAC
ncbi:L,D-transpeptidase [Paludibacterium denitrificans]|uniref:L,D-transpeptidase n=1 Tax=Paludibacterium denitrificans TaxID=2675226 RepID=UPI0024780339|nr:L,D-transpeptidase [Paludibacterium denitrificans]